MSSSRPRILSVDDHQMLNLMRQKVLSSAGYDCDLAYSAEQGLAMVMTAQYDAVLLDYYLPDTTGLQVANTIHTLRPDMPIMLVTGEEFHERSDAIHSYFVKGEGPEALISKLDGLLNRKLRRAAAS